MIIFNTTFHLNPSRKEEFLRLLRSELIPAATADGTLTSPQLALVMIEQETEYVTYSLQFACPTPDALAQWQSTGDTLFTKLQQRFGEELLFFASLLQPIAHE